MNEPQVTSVTNCTSNETLACVSGSMLEIEPSKLRFYWRQQKATFDNQGEEPGNEVQ
jgi:hypothetical protein